MVIFPSELKWMKWTRAARSIPNRPAGQSQARKRRQRYAAAKPPWAGD
jgi:hypothetical protein